MHVEADFKGYFGHYGGKFIPEILQRVLSDLEEAYEKAKGEDAFWDEYKNLLATYSCRPTPLYLAHHLTKRFDTARIFIKREDLNQTGAHKLNNVMGQGLLIKRMGKKRVIAETGAGQHGLATATMAARLGLECVIYMGAEDVRRQRPNVFWMEKMGAKVVPVTSGGGILKDAINEAFKDWVANVKDTHYALGTVCGPHPFPEMVARFQAIIGEEAREQILFEDGQLPSAVYACVGGGSNAVGIFQRFLGDKDVELVGVEAGGLGKASAKHASRLAYDAATVGVAQGYKTYFIQDEDGQLQDTHSISAGLDYVGVSPILAHLWETERVRMEAATDEEVMKAHEILMLEEGLIAALESTHAFAGAFKELEKYDQDESIIINLSGRGDKDIFTIAEAYGDASWKEFIRTKAEQYHL